MTTQRLRIHSDFYDYFDWCLEPSGSLLYQDVPVLRRCTTDGPDRPGIFAMLQAHGYRTMPHGRVQDLVPRLHNEDVFADCQGADSCTQVVVYTDPTKHCGEGKQKLSSTDALRQFPHLYASKFLPSLPGNAGRSIRELHVGDRVFWLEYSNPDGWMSNNGPNLEIRVLCEAHERQYHPTMRLPLYAVDYVPCVTSTRTDADAADLFAVDLNIAPGIKGTGLEQLLSAREAADAIIAAFYHFQATGGFSAPVDRK